VPPRPAVFRGAPRPLELQIDPVNLGSLGARSKWVNSSGAGGAKTLSSGKGPRRKSFCLRFAQLLDFLRQSLFNGRG